MVERILSRAMALRASWTSRLRCVLHGLPPSWYTAWRGGRNPPALPCSSPCAYGVRSMKVILLAGGMGTRLSEETQLKPKPMVEVGGKPLVWHIMKHYAHHGLKEFFIALGYKGDVIKRYFLDYTLVHSNLTVHLHSGLVDRELDVPEDWV